MDSNSKVHRLCTPAFPPSVLDFFPAFLFLSVLVQELFVLHCFSPAFPLSLLLYLIPLHLDQLWYDLNLAPACKWKEKNMMSCVSNVIPVTTLPARECANPAVPSNGGSVPREDVAAPGHDPDGQTQPAEPWKQPPSDHLTIIIISLSHCQLHVAGTYERSYYSALLGFTLGLIVYLLFDQLMLYVLYTG